MFSYYDEIKVGNFVSLQLTMILCSLK